MTNWILPLVVSWSCVFRVIVAVAGSNEDYISNTIPDRDFILPAIKYLRDQSFRGLSNGVVNNYDVSGHATVLPGVHDFLRLVPPSPLAHGAIFARAPMTMKEWVVDIAFRVHGPSIDVDLSGDGIHTRVANKGGRGLGFWYTKTKPKGPITISSDPTQRVAPPPSMLPPPYDPADAEVSFFGYKTQFDGLGVLFDSTPSAPIYPRSDIKNYNTDKAHGAEASGVISGILDDGQKNWLDKPNVVKIPGQDATYLGSSAGECAGMFRNAEGLLWARISHFNNTIRCDLDLTAHTTLSAAGRDFAHHCWTINDVKLEAGSYFGVSGIASGSTEPDAIDLYAIDVFEVMKDPSLPGFEGQTGEPALEDNDPLEGTQAKGSDSLAHEIFMSQAHMMQAIDALSKRVDELTTKLDMSKMPFPSIITRLMTLDQRIAAMASGTPANFQQVPPPPPSPVEAAPPPVPQFDSSKSFEHIVQLQERLMAELAAFGRKLDTSNSQSLSSLTTLSSRMSESLALLHRTTTTLDQNLPIKLPWFWIIAGAAVIGLYLVYRKSRSEYGWSGRGKKMI